MDWHYKVEPSGSVSIRSLDNPLDSILMPPLVLPCVHKLLTTVPPNVLVWIGYNLSGHPAIADGAGSSGTIGKTFASGANDVGEKGCVRVREDDADAAVVVTMQ
jgi:hypothetical protein